MNPRDKIANFFMQGTVNVKVYNFINLDCSRTFYVCSIRSPQNVHPIRAL